jgi:hypothetical protein
MSEQDNRESEHLNTEDTEIEIDLDSEVEPTEDVEELKAQLQKKDEIIRQTLARSKAAEQKLKTYKPEPKADKDLYQTVSELKLAEQKRQFGYENSLSPEETDHIFRLNPNPSKETLDDVFVKGGLEAIRNKKKLESNTPALNSRSPKFVVPSKKDMTTEDKQKAFEEFMASKKR